MNISTLEPSQVLKLGLNEGHPRSGTSSKRRRSKSIIVPVLDNSIISSQEFKTIKR